MWMRGLALWGCELWLRAGGRGPRGEGRGAWAGGCELGVVLALSGLGF